MREIKFRAWVEDTMYHRGGRMYYYTFAELIEGIVAGDTHKYHKWMQYTGLKDKNGKEIYEGDILKHPSEIYKLHIIKWDTFRWTGIWKHKISTVIGNIYENPELLKKGE